MIRKIILYLSDIIAFPLIGSVVSKVSNPQFDRGNLLAKGLVLRIHIILTVSVNIAPHVTIGITSYLKPRRGATFHITFINRIGLKENASLVTVI